MKKILFLTISLVISFNSHSINQVFNNMNISAEDTSVSEDNENDLADDSYIPLISENKVWKYILAGELPLCDIETDPVIINIESRFDGTIEIDGRQYHILKTIDTSTPENEEKAVFPDYYLREEPGKVYVYLPENCCIYNNKWEHLEPGEYLLYDFTLKVGDNIDIVGGYFKYSHLPREFEIQESKVCNIETIDLAGQKSKKYGIRLIYPEHTSLPIDIYDGRYDHIYLEGIGSINFNKMFLDGYGDFLPFFNFNKFALTDNGKSVYGYYLIGVYDNDGNIIYNVETHSVSGIDKLKDNSNHSLEYFNLQGQRVNNPVKGQLYIRHDGNKVSKVIY